MNHGSQEVFTNHNELEKCTTVKVKLESRNLPVLQCPVEHCSFITHIEESLRTHVLDHVRHLGEKRCELRYYNCPTCPYFTTISNLINEHISLIHRDADCRGETEVLVRWERLPLDPAGGDRRDGGHVSPYPASAPIETCSSTSSPPPVVSLESQYSRQVSSPSPSHQDLAIPLPNEGGDGSVGGYDGDLASPQPQAPPPSFQQTPPSSTSSMMNSIALPIPNRPTSPPTKKINCSMESKPASTTSGGLHGSRKRKRAIPARCQQPAPESANMQTSSEDLGGLTSWHVPAAMLFMRQPNNSGSPREAASFDEMDGVVQPAAARTTGDGLNNNLKLGLLTSLYSGSLTNSIRAMFSGSNAAVSGIDLNGFNNTPATGSQDQALDMSLRPNGQTTIKELNLNAMNDKMISEAPIDPSSLLLTATSGSADINKVLSRLPLAQHGDSSVCVSVPGSPEPSEQSATSPPPDSRSGSEPSINAKGSSNGSGNNTSSKPHRQNFTQQQNDILNRWYQRHSEKPYPSTEQTKELANECTLSYSQVKKWFANKRARTSKGNRSANGGSNCGSSTLGDTGSPMDCTPTVSFARSMLDLAQVVPPSSTSSSPKMPPLAVSVDPLRSPGAAGVGPHVNGGNSSSGGSGASLLQERFPFMLGGANNAAYQMQRLLQTSLANLNPLNLPTAAMGVSLTDVKKETDRSDGEEIDEEEAEKK